MADVRNFETGSTMREKTYKTFQIDATM